MGDFDFSFGDFTLDLSFGEPKKATSSKKSPQESKSYYEKRGSGLDNLFLMTYEPTNEWGIADTTPLDADLTGIEWFSFWDKSKCHAVQTGDWSNTGIHFFIDDFQFVSVWKQPKKWLELFRQCRAVVAPDFSVYNEMTMTHQLWNHCRRQFLAKYWQDNGVNIVSCVTWDLLGGLKPWHIAEIPKGTYIARTWVGKLIDKQQQLSDMLKIIEMLEPKGVFIKCCKPDEMELRKHFDFEAIPPKVGWL